MAETQINGNQLALNSETGSFAEMIFATQVGKEQIAQALTSKGTQTASTETLVQMADKISALNTNNSLMYGKGKNILDSITTQSVTSVRGVVLLKNNYALISTSTTGYICDLSQEYDNWSDFLSKAAITVTWNKAFSGNNYDLVSASEDSCTIARTPYGYNNTSIEFYILVWNNGIPTSISYDKTSNGTSKTIQAGNQANINKFSYNGCSPILVSNDRKLVAYKSSDYYLRLESYDDDNIYADASDYPTTYSWGIPYEITINGTSVSVFCWKNYSGNSNVNDIYCVRYDFTLSYTDDSISAITYNNKEDYSFSLGDFSCCDTEYRGLYIKEYKALIFLVQKRKNVSLTASSQDRIALNKLIVCKLPTTVDNVGACFELDLGRKYKYFAKSNTIATNYEGYNRIIAGNYYQSYFDVLNILVMQSTNFLCKTTKISENVVRTYTVAGSTFDIDFSNNTITETTSTICNYVENYNISYKSKVVLFKQTESDVYYGLYDQGTASIITTNPSANEIITDIELNYNNTPICIYPLQVYTPDINGLVQETLEVSVPEE